MSGDIQLPIDPAGGRSSSAQLQGSGDAPWGYREILLLGAATLLSQLLATVLAVSVLGRVADIGQEAAVEMIRRSPRIVVPLQIATWLPMLAYVAYVVAVQFRQPLRLGLAWKALPRPVASYLRMGSLLAFGSALASIAAGDAGGQSLMAELLSDPESLWIIAAFGVLVAPCLEEVVFRGFLFGALERMHGTWLALLATSAIFAALHGSQYGWQWPQLAVLMAVGCAFGAVRISSRSTKASTLVHAWYNGLLFLALAYAQHWLG